jgi:hypothetical protein
MVKPEISTHILLANPKVFLVGSTLGRWTGVILNVKEIECKVVTVSRLYPLAVSYEQKLSAGTK